MNLQQLRYFLAAAKFKSFSKAAEAMYISQPALSKQIALLENQLQITLFERTSNGVQLTHKGEQLYQQLAPLVNQLDAILRAFTEPEEIRLGVLPSIGTYYLPELVSRLPFLRLIPIVKNTSAELVELIEAGEADAAIIQDRPQSGTMRQTRLFEETYLAAVPIGHPLSQQTEIRLSDFNQTNVILQQTACDSRDYFELEFRKLGLKPEITLVHGLFESLLAYAVSMEGIAFIPKMMAASVTHHQIVYKPIENQYFKRTIHLLARSNDIFNRLMEALSTLPFISSEAPPQWS
ncbi:LysR family transcriptional regulator [Anoxybacillus sp. PDR2]|uniref:LysR family transcriptional regulator n=1 Tax=Anoxybacillus sp. PDR2 TaxID=1636720 RepID=UPI0013195A22|nr:LysR family transcriptional regulator [Anoxybacillus sp. PDR2]QHC05642.1 LysR family transcriptional regulator [Anoxybacillus sp. PDR2]